MMSAALHVVVGSIAMRVTGESIRYPVAPRDIPPAKAARRLHVTLKEFEEMKDELYRRGFPRPDPTTGNFDLVAIDRWMDERHPASDPNKPRDARELLPPGLLR
jgi:hypothetical protein